MSELEGLRIITPWDSIGQYIEVWRDNERLLCWGPYGGCGPYTKGELEADLKEVRAKYPLPGDQQ